MSCLLGNSQGCALLLSTLGGSSTPKTQGFSPSQWFINPQASSGSSPFEQATTLHNVFHQTSLIEGSSIGSLSPKLDHYVLIVAHVTLLLCIRVRVKPLLIPPTLGGISPMLTIVSFHCACVRESECVFFPTQHMPSYLLCPLRLVLCLPQQIKHLPFSQVHEGQTPWTTQPMLSSIFLSLCCLWLKFKGHLGLSSSFQLNLLQSRPI